MYTIEFYNKNTNDILCYIKKYGDFYVDISYFTKMLNESLEHYDKDILIKYTEHTIYTIFKKHKEGSMSEHEFNHTKKDYFNNVEKEDVGFRVFNKVQEIRRRKINKIKKRIK